MAKQRINIGSAANDTTGDPLRTAFTKINQNFDEVYANVGSSNIRLSNNIMSTTSGDINLVPDGTSDVVIGSLSQLNVSATTSSTSTTTGALLVGGGVGIGGSLYIGGGLSTAGALYAGTASFGALDSTPIGYTTTSTGKFTTVTATLVNSGNVVSPAMYSSTLATFYETKASFANIGAGTATSLSIASGGAIYTDNASVTNFISGNVLITGGLIGGPVDANIRNFISGNVKITGGVISGVGVGYTSIENTPIGVTIANTAVFTTATIGNLVTSNAAITGGSINSTKIGNATPSTGVFTSVTGYHTGAIGANTPNSGVFTSVSTTSGGKINGYLTGSIGANVANTAVFTDIQSVTGFIDTCYFTNMVANSSSYFRLDVYAQTLNARTIGNTGANIYGTHNGPVFGPFNGTIGAIGANSGVFTTLTATSGFNGAASGPLNGVVGGVTPNAATFTNVTINGNLTASNFNIIGNVTGTLTGTASSATTAGTATYASTAGLASAATTVVQAAQPNITSTGTLVSVFVTNTATVGNLSTGGDVTAIGNIASSGLLTATASILGNAFIYPGNLTIANPRTITNSIGTEADHTGKIVWDRGNIYVCTKEYDGVNPIWKRVSLISF